MLRLDQPALIRTVIRELVESDLSACQGGAILRELISLAFRRGGPASNEWERKDRNKRSSRGLQLIIPLPVSYPF